MSKKEEYIKKAQAHFDKMAQDGATMEDMVLEYFERYCIFGTSSEIRTLKMVVEMNITIGDIRALIGTLLLEEHRGFVKLKKEFRRK